MKRRTAKQLQNINLDDHRKAFHHAMTILKPLLVGKVGWKYGLPFRFTAELTRENGGCVHFKFSLIRGLVISCPDSDWKSHSSAKGIDQRLRHYRKVLIAWHHSDPLTFRSFNLLLAAVSYDVTQSVSAQRD